MREAVRVSPDLAELVELALAAARASDGIFDPTVIDALEAYDLLHDRLAPSERQRLDACFQRYLAAFATGQDVAEHLSQ